VQSAINLTEEFLVDAAKSSELLIKFANISEPWCEGLDTIPVGQNITDVLYYDINSLAENVSQGLYDFNENLIEEVSSIQNDLYYTASMLQSVNKYLDYSYWVFFAATIFASVFIVLIFSVSMNMFLSELHLPTLCLPPFPVFSPLTSL
jgi:urea transporter